MGLLLVQEPPPREMKLSREMSNNKDPTKEPLAVPVGILPDRIYEGVPVWVFVTRVFFVIPANVRGTFVQPDVKRWSGVVETRASLWLAKLA